MQQEPWPSYSCGAVAGTEGKEDREKKTRKRNAERGLTEQVKT